MHMFQLSSVEKLTFEKPQVIKTQTLWFPVSNRFDEIVIIHDTIIIIKRLVVINLWNFTFQSHLVKKKDHYPKPIIEKNNEHNLHFNTCRSLLLSFNCISRRFICFNYRFGYLCLFFTLRITFFNLKSKSWAWDQWGRDRFLPSRLG